MSDKNFESECLTAFDALRGALAELYSSVGADPESPQDVARRFRVNKTLTWNVSKVMGGNADRFATLTNVPGESAMGSLLRAMEREGAAPTAVQRVRNAASTLQRTVEVHFGDRATLDLIVDGRAPERHDHLALSRKLAFRGNSGLWGVQAKTRLMTVLMAPDAQSPDRIDMAMVRGYLGLRRLRSDIRWPVFQLRNWGPMSSQWEPLEGTGEGSGGLPLLERFSTVAPADLEAVRTSDGTDYVLMPGPIGNAGAIDCFIGDFARSAASKYRTDRDTTGEFGATISAPTERLIFDLLVHESLAFALEPEVRAFGGVFMERSEDSSAAGPLPIPVPQTVTALPGRPPVVATPGVPRYPEMVSFVEQRMQWNLGDFRGCRLELMYPPMGATVLLRFELPAGP